MSTPTSSNGTSDSKSLHTAGSAQPMILCIDNYDSFTYNLVRLIRRAAPGTAVQVCRNDAIDPRELSGLAASGILLSPGPGRPENAGICTRLVAELAGSVPILGVCLGLQCVAHAFGAGIVRARRLMHGKTSLLLHSGDGLFRGLPCPTTVMRYHSLAVERHTLPEQFVVNAWTADGEVMGIQHRTLPVFGVQFHPESFLTAEGTQIINNFLHHGLKTPAGSQG